MRKADFRQEGFLNDKNIQLIYDKKKNDIENLLKITTSEEFLDVFDDDMVNKIFLKYFLFNKIFFYRTDF